MNITNTKNDEFKYEIRIQIEISTVNGIFN